MHTNAITVLLLSSVALAGHIPSAARRHHENWAVDVEKRGGSARFSWYDITTNEVACGGRYQPNDYVVALDAAQWDGGSHCGEKVTLTYNGKTATATIVDECAEGCPNNALDLTHGLFQNLIGSPEVIGISYGEFSFGSAPKPEPVTTKEKPTPTSTPPPPPPPPTSTTHTTTKEKTTSIAPTTTSVQPTATSSSSSSAAASSSAPIAVPTAPGVSLGIASIAGTVDSSTTQNLVEISNAMVNFGVVVLSA